VEQGYSGRQVVGIDLHRRGSVFVRTGYIDLHPEVIVGWKRAPGRRSLPVGKKSANQLIAALRAVGERANAQLEHWRIPANDFPG
jgi:hypothetical protein